MAYIVILRHFTQSFLPITPVSALICNGISTVAVPIYFIISGYLFFSKPFSAQRLKHQLLRIFKMDFIHNFIFSGSYFHLWFLPSLIFALGIVSFIHKFKTQSAAVIAVGLFILGLLYESYRFLVPQFEGVFEIYGKIFLTTRNGLFFGMIYVYLGYFFTQHKIQIKRYQVAFGIAVSMFLLCIEAILMFKYREISVMNLTVFALPASVFIFIFAQQQEVNVKEDKLLFLRKLSTVLFCVHPIFTAGFTFVNEHFIFIPTLCTLGLVVLGSTVSSIIIVKMSEKIKLMSYFV